MSRYSPLTLALWGATILGSLIVAVRLRRASSVPLRALRSYLWIEASVGLAGFACIAFGPPWAYYHEYMGTQILDVAAQCVLLWGVCASLCPRASGVRPRAVGVLLICLTGFLSALGVTAAISDHALRNWIFATHVCGYTFCCVAFATTMLAWVRGCAWPPAAARVMIGYSITTSITFAVEQSQALLGRFSSPVLHLPPIIYFAALAIWGSAVSLDKNKLYSPEEMALLEAALAISAGDTPGPRRSTQE